MTEEEIRDKARIEFPKIHDMPERRAYYTGFVAGMKQSESEISQLKIKLEIAELEKKAKEELDCAGDTMTYYYYEEEIAELKKQLI